MSLDKTFITPERYEEIKKAQLNGPNGWLLFVACNSGVDLARNVKKEYERKLTENKSSLLIVPLLDRAEDFDMLTKVFDDTETKPRLRDHVAGSNAFVFQSLFNKADKTLVNDNLMQLYQVIRALKVHGAKKITAVTPYLSYVRQEKPTFGERELTTAKLVADLFIVSGMDDLLAYHLHTDSIKGIYEPHRVVALTGLDLFIELFERFKGIDDVIAVSTDAGGAKFTINLAKKLDIPYAISSKYRPKEQVADILGIVGDFGGKKVAIIADDESVTFGSIFNATKSLYESHGVHDIYVAISHNKLSKSAIPKLLEANEKYGLKELHVTDSVPQISDITELKFLKVHSLAERLACTINRLHYDQSVSQIFYRLQKNK